ncbi:hypothetical protein [Larkinella rosea]|uniref:DUF4843 domain-containing protein n=1 Tax=Larkinella rosea TaxID=2025312 RepID=A0A3P1BGW7_9BACT|nr:hypothetical protein [Larkinella rosea]RRB00133.1 hypothetical protein EHT25_26275 [Larkinella rosea]
MNSFRLAVSLAFLFIFFNGCKKDNAQPQAPANVLTNGDFEVNPFPLWYSATLKNSKTNPTSYTVDYSTEAATSPVHSIKVSCEAVKSDSTYQVLERVVYTRDVPIKEGAKLTLKVKIKTANIQGNGISILFGGFWYINGTVVTNFKSSTEGKVSITGSKEFTEYTLTCDSAPKDLYAVYADLIYLPKTTGTAFYDDMSLTIN